MEPGELTDDESDNEDKVSQEKLSLLGKTSECAYCTFLTTLFPFNTAEFEKQVCKELQLYLKNTK